MTATQEDLRPYYLDTPGRRFGRLLRDAGLLEIGWMVSMVLIAAVSGILQQLIPAVVAALCVPLALPGEDGPFFYAPAVWWKGWRIKRHGDVVCELDEDGNVVGGGMPALLDGLFIDNFLGQFASVYDEGRNTDTVYLSTGGWKHANDTIPQRADAQRRIAAAFRVAIAQTEDNIAYGTVNGRRQYDPTEWAAKLPEGHLQSGFEDDSTMDAGDRAAKENLLKVFDDIVLDQHAKHVSLFPVTVPRPESWAKLIENPENFTVQQLRRSALYRVLVSLQQGLATAGYRGIKLFTKESLFHYLYTSWNVSYLTPQTVLQGLLSGYYRVPGVGPDSPPLVRDGKLVHISQPFPRITKVLRGGRSGRRYDTLQMEDNNYHFVVVVKGFRRKRWLPGAAYPLTVGPHEPWLLHAQTCNTASKPVEQFLLRRRRNFLISWFRRSRGLDSMFEELEVRERVEAESATIDKIYISGSKPIRSDHRFVGSATSLEELDLVYENLLATLRKEDVSFYRVTGRARLFPAFLVAILGPRL